MNLYKPIVSRRLSGAANNNMSYEPHNAGCLNKKMTAVYKFFAI